MESTWCESGSGELVSKHGPHRVAQMSKNTHMPLMGFLPGFLWGQLRLGFAALLRVDAETQHYGCRFSDEFPGAAGHVANSQHAGRSGVRFRGRPSGNGRFALPLT